MRSAVRRVAGILAALALLAPTAEARPRIVGGTPAPAATYGFTAQVHADFTPADPPAEDFVCGGTLVAARYVVTAAHCLRDPTPLSIEVVLGTTTLDDPVAPRHAATVAGLDAGLDIGVLRLATPTTVAPARLPRVEDAGLAAVGAVGRALGWGATSPSQPTSSTLLQVDLPFRTDADCQAAFDDYDPGVTLCAGDPGQRRDTCNGDSGGPLLAPDGVGGAVLAGATSYGAENCGTAFGAYVELASAPVNGFLRSIVPQVEVTPNGGAAFAGDQLTFTAAPRDPDGSGPFGGYDQLEWDVDGDGFDDAVGATAVQVTVVEGLNTVAVRATDSSGNSEVRRASVVGRRPSFIGFATNTVTALEGNTARLTTFKTGDGTGTVVATPADGSAPVAALLPNPGPATLTYDVDAAVRGIDYVLTDDDRVERRQSFVVTLGTPTGDLRVGADDRVVVRVQDDDAEVRVPRTRRRAVRGGAFTLPVDPNIRGRLEAVARVGRTTVAKAGRRRIGNARRRELRLRLTPAARRRIAAGEVLTTRVQVRLTPAGGGLPARTTRTVRVG
jgi:hypothetical protein